MLPRNQAHSTDLVIARQKFRISRRKTGKRRNRPYAVVIFTAAIPVWRSIGSTVFLPVWLSLLARAYGELGQFDEAWRHIGQAITAVETTKETWYVAEVHRSAGEIALMSPEADAAKAEACFERALAVARAQQAKSLELGAAMSMARLQGKRNEARELLAPVPVFGVVTALTPVCPLHDSEMAAGAFWRVSGSHLARSENNKSADSPVLGKRLF